MPETGKIDTGTIGRMLEMWRNQPGYANPDVRRVIDSSGDNLLMLVESGDQAALLEAIRELKAALSEVYTTPSAPKPR